jgi:hypothetical protein
VYYTGSQWAIFNQDHAAILVDAAFNVLVLVPTSDVFVHTATAGNSALDFTTIDNALTNGHPNAIVFTTPNWNPGGVGPGVYNNDNIGVYYLGGQWRIFNQDSAAIPVNAAFNVIIPTAGANVFVHKATAGNISSDLTAIDNPLTNSNPDAIVFVTPNWNPGGVGGTYDDDPIGVYYHAGKWAIFNQDGVTNMPLDASFNVFVPPAGAGVFVHTATAGNSAGDFTKIDNPLTNGNPNAIVFVTPNYNPGGACPCMHNNHPIGVYYNGSQWAIFNQDHAAIPVDAAFNVLVYNKLYLPLVVR